jgi:hypothetical protein
MANIFEYDFEFSKGDDNNRVIFESLIQAYEEQSTDVSRLAGGRQLRNVGTGR